MNARMKFHLMAVTLIVLTVTLLSMLFPPAQKTVVKVTTVAQYPITIVNATWGKNCNARIERKLQTLGIQRAKPRDFTGKASPAALALVKQGNVLSQLRKLCQGKGQCQFKADAKTLGEPFAECRKTLEVYYYCSETERVRKRSFSQGKIVSLKCKSRKVR
jgi:hypothetical protein